MTEYAVTPVDSWRPIDLAAIHEQPQERATLANGLAYTGRSHLWSGEPESGKSWVALIACHIEILNERHVLYIDFETNEREILDRLRSLGVTNYELDYFMYVRPSDPFGAEGVFDYVNTLLEERQPSIVVVDAYAGALDLHGLKPNEGADIERLDRAFFKPLRAYGAASIALDHLTKDRDNRGKFSIGSERKLGVVDVHLGFEVAKGKPMGRERTGLVHVRTHKDRPGFLPRPRVCDIEIESEASGALRYELKPPEHFDEEHPFRPTGLMERVSRYLEERGEPTVRSVIEEEVKGKAEFVRAAIDVLTREGFTAEAYGTRRGTRTYEHKRAYREELDPTQKKVPV
jgi:hypothetical protein